MTGPKPLAGVESNLSRAGEGAGPQICDTRDGVIAEVRSLPESALDFRPNDASRTARELVQHIIENGLPASLGRSAAF